MAFAWQLLALFILLALIYPELIDLQNIEKSDIYHPSVITVGLRWFLVSLNSKPVDLPDLPFEFSHLLSAISKYSGYFELAVQVFVFPNSTADSPFHRNP